MAKPCRLLVIHILVVLQVRHAQGLEVPHPHREPPPVEAKRQADPRPKHPRARRGHVPPGPCQLQREAPAAELVHLRAAENVQAREMPAHDQVGSASPQAPHHPIANITHYPGGFYTLYAPLKIVFLPRFLPYLNSRNIQIRLASHELFRIRPVPCV